MQSTPLLDLGGDAGPDPDVAAAIEAFRPAVVEIRARSAKLIDSDVTAAQRAEQSAIDDLVADMTSRCERLGITIDDLFALINADLASRKGDPTRPHGALLQALIEENGRTYAAEKRAWAELDAARARVDAVIVERIAADRACAGFVAGFAVRGGQA